MAVNNEFAAFQREREKCRNKKIKNKQRKIMDKKITNAGVHQNVIHLLCRVLGLIKFI